MSQSIWRQAGRVSFANAQDFMNEESISKNCRDSYQNYILDTKGEDLPVNDKGYSITEWDYTDNTNNARYVASWNKDFGWSVMKTAIPKKGGKQDAQQQSTLIAAEPKPVAGAGAGAGANIPTIIELKLSPKTEENLGQIAEAAQMIATILAGKDIKTAKDMLQQK